jgi:hypothetical protein
MPQATGFAVERTQNEISLASKDSLQNSSERALNTRLLATSFANSGDRQWAPIPETGASYT